jgi:predicted enzyme related to lactoylglutathione lyase
VILNANEGEGLVWLSIPADDFAAAVRFFGETRAWMWRSMRGNTAEPSGRERRQDPAVRP